MNKLTVLIEGFANINKDGTWDATSSSTLVNTGKLKIVADPGCNRELLLDALEKQNLNTGDIDYVFVSHYHPDHCSLMGIFENAIIFDGTQWQKGQKGGDLKGKFLPGTDIEIIKTPGHTPDHASLLVKTQNGKILIGADVFWWKAGQKQIMDISVHDEFASDQKTLEVTRQKVLKLADFIVPGHGRMFKV